MSAARTRTDAAIRRASDFLFALAGLLLALPLFAAVALAILWDSGRPIFFRQIRMGQDGRTFRIWKFRTMRNGPPGAQVTAAGDARVTKVGAHLRRYKLDELPQLINVLVGQMSLIGPRPEVPRFVDLSDPVWRAVLSVKPGITDPATLLYRNEESRLAAAPDPEAYYRGVLLPAKLQLNLQHLSSRSLRQDLRLLVLTVCYSFFPTTFDTTRLKQSLESSLGNRQ